MDFTNGPATAFMFDLGNPDDLRNAAAAGSTPAERPRVNAHIHLPPNFSAFDSVKQAVDLAAEQGVGVLGASNYYDFAVYADFASEARRQAIFPLYGLEIIALIDDLVRAGVKINDPGNPGKMYICGKGITRFEPLSPEASELMGVIREKDAERMARMIARLADVFAGAGLETGLDEDAVKEQIVRRHGSLKETVHIQERHVAQAFQEALFEKTAPERRAALLERICGVPSKAEAEDAAAVQNEIRSHLMKSGKPAFVDETFVGFDHACRLILALGGIPCYPTLADGASPVCPYEAAVESLIGDLKARGVHCAEFIPIRNTPEVLEKYVRAVRAAGLVVTSGTEHNTRELIPIEPTCLKGAPVSDELKMIFWEGACVVAAHQFLTIHGEPGFVDPRGRPNGAYSSDEERIAAFAALGAAVIRQYQDRYRG